MQIVAFAGMWIAMLAALVLHGRAEYRRGMKAERDRWVKSLQGCKIIDPGTYEP